jgi:2-dehydro-3-deoxygluconokinase
MTRVVCIGECMVELRPVGEGLFRRGVAGDVYNTAVYLKRQAPRMDVQFATVTGADPLSEAMRDAWREEGIGEELAVADPDRGPGLYLIETDAAGERSFHYWRGESAARGWARALASQAGALDGADLVYLSGISLAILTPEDRQRALALLQDLRGGQTRLAFDPNLRPALWGDLGEARRAFELMAGLADILLPSRQDLQLLYGEADSGLLANRLIDLGAREFAITAEAGPCIVYDSRCSPPGGAVPPRRSAAGRCKGRRVSERPGGRLRGLKGAGAEAFNPLRPSATSPCGGGSELTRIAAPRVAAVVDTSGAGDSFNGAYLAARLRGESAPSAARAGLELAANVVTRPGAIADTFPA